MTYQETVDLIRDISEEVNPTGTFIHGRRVDGSLAYDGAYPQILLEPFITKINTLTDFDTCDLIIGFMYEDAAENTAEQRETIIALADDLCRSFITELKTRAIDIENMRVRPFYMIFAGVVSGYVLEFSLISKTASCA